MSDPGQFEFNGRRGDFEQVAGYLPAFLRVYAQLDRPGSPPRVAQLRGLIPELAGPHEGIAIYLLQNLLAKREREQHVNLMLEHGYRHVAYVPFGGERFQHVIVYGDYGDHDTGSHAWDEFEYARLVPQTNRRLARTDGPIAGVIPYRGRTITRRVIGERVLVKSIPDQSSTTPKP